MLCIPTSAFPRKEAAKSLTTKPPAHEHCSPPSSSISIRPTKHLDQASAAARRGGIYQKRPARQNKNRKEALSHPHNVEHIHVLTTSGVGRITRRQYMLFRDPLDIRTRFNHIQSLFKNGSRG